MQIPLKICIEKTSQDDIEHIKRLKSVSKTDQHFTKLSAAFYTAKLWPNNSTITVGFLEQPDNIHRTSLIELEAHRDENRNSFKIDPLQYEINNIDIISAIKKIVIERIIPITNLKFVFIENPSTAQIRISFDSGQGAWALLGTDCLTKTDPKDATMNLGWFDVPTTIHEFGHVIGLIHEHQNPKGNLIQWDENAVYSWAEQTQGWDHDTTFHNIIEKYASEQINGSEFDPNSIMLYFFPASLTKNNQGTHENLRLSPYDVQYINSVYPNSPESPQKFYQDIYNEHIEPSVAFDRVLKNDKGEDKKDSSNNLIFMSNIVIWTGIIVGITVVIYIFIQLFLSKQVKNSYIKQTNYKTLFG